MKRRDVLTGALKLGAAFSVSAPSILPRPAQAATTISFASYGGSYGDFVKQCWIKPFTAETGISVEFITGATTAKAKAQVASNNIEWDIFDAATYYGEKEGLWEPTDTKIVDPSRFVQKPPSFAVPTFSYAGGIAYDPSRTKRPANDFPALWDIVSFPGRRVLRTWATEMFELALLADGVAPSELYPLDVDRAFKSLNRIKPYVHKWVAEVTQTITLIQTNEADYSYAYAHRVKAAKESGVSIDFSFDQCIIQMNYCAVLRGSPRREAAMRFLEFVTRPSQQALIANRLSMLPTTQGIEHLVEDEARRWVPDLKSPKNVVFSAEYWGDHFFELDKRFKEWMLT
ncbi:ABC transporter substrate-binding protein [Bradyrhizobium sp. 1.29L]